MFAQNKATEVQDAGSGVVTFFTTDVKTDFFIDNWPKVSHSSLSLFTTLFTSPCSSFAMSKTTGKKLHWRSKVQDSFVPLLGPSGEPGIAVGGGADYGEFPFVTSAPGGGLTVGDIILEIGGTPVLGMTLGDVRGVLSSCPHPIRIKTVPPGRILLTCSPTLMR